jgi:hypothetical protein
MTVDNYPLVYIIILNWNGRKDTAECLESLQHLTYPNFKTIVVDNGSTDNSVFFLKEKYREVDFVENEDNLGFARGNNIGIREAVGRGADYVFLLNNDTLVDKDMLTILIKAAQDNPAVGMLGPKINYYYDKDRIWAAGGKVIFPLALTFHRRGRRQDKLTYSKIVDVDYQPACALLVKKETIGHIGLLHTSYQVYYEDTDWCLRAKKSGYRVVCVESAKIWHKVSASSGGWLSPLRLYWKTRSGYIFFKKHTRFIWKIVSPLALIMQFIATCIFAIFQGRPGSIKAIILALRDIILSREADIFALAKRKKKRLLFVSHSSRLEGAELTLFLLAKKLTEKNYDIYVLCPGQGRLTKKLKKYDIKYFTMSIHRWVYSCSYLNRSYVLSCFKLNNFLMLQETKKMKKLIINKIKPDLIVNNTITINQAVLIARELKIPLIWYVHEFLRNDSFLKELNLSYQDIAEFIINHADRILFNSKATKDIFESRIKDKEGLNKLQAKSDILYPLVEIDREQHISNKTKKIKPGNNFNMAVIGSVFAGKGQLLVLKAFNRIKDEVPYAQLKFAGNINDKNYYNRLISYIDSNALKTRVSFCGYINNIEDYIADKIDLVIVPSINEPFGRIALEAIMLGVPVIASNSGGLNEIVSNKETGILVDAQSVDDIASAIRTILKDKRLKMKLEKAYKILPTVLKPEQVIDDFLKNVESIC